MEPTAINMMFANNTIQASLFPCSRMLSISQIAFTEKIMEKIGNEREIAARMYGSALFMNGPIRTGATKKSKSSTSATMEDLFHGLCIGMLRLYYMNKNFLFPHTAWFEPMFFRALLRLLNYIILMCTPFSGHFQNPLPRSTL